MVDILWRDISSIPIDANAPAVKAIQESVNNLLATVPGQKLFNPQFGCNLDSLLFETIDIFTALDIRQELIRCIQTWDPRILVSSLTKIEPDEDNNQYNVHLVLEIYGVDPVTLNFSLNKLN